ncbi:hypothetical protein K1720_04280 [Thermococcus argininiproducens]|uniref:Uncharacterized protein n=1 Tax=Thermococcus argininiproducens TaxID=2866384 RepID=A0A9E7MBM6_9EURY|nr:hypothetical protein [Thermococcus argininiproducens]USH00664.1 hypothetical protein K1720_04280 [Thermococcus argininiproducens]
MRLMRFGPSMLFLRTSNVEVGENFITNLFGVPKTSVEEAWNQSGELDTIVFVTPAEEWKTILDLTRGAFLIKMRSDSVLKELLNAKAPFDRANLGPQIILLRVPKEAEKISEIIPQRYNAIETSFARGVNEGEEKDTLLLVTDKKLVEHLSVGDLKGAFLIKKNFIDVYRALRIDLPILLFKLLPEGWREITIRIYDTKKRYEENIERVLLVLEDLDLGYVVSEGWDWDYPRPFMRIRVYKIKLITWEDPLRIKFLLKGLEYRGYQRFADIDVFVEKKKIPWIEVSREYSSKFDVAKAARDELESLLSEETRKILHEIETKILNDEDLQGES